MMLPEVEQYLHTLDDLRNQVGGIIRDLPAEALNWRPALPSGADPTNSLGVLAVHVAGAEHFWIAECIGAYPHTRGRDQEFTFVAQSAEEPLARLEKTSDETHAVLKKLTAEKLGSSFMKDGMAVPVRWSIHHVIFHSSLHIGHMQLTFQLWNKGKATSSPRWFDRLPKK